MSSLTQNRPPRGLYALLRVVLAIVVILALTGLSIATIAAGQASVLLFGCKLVGSQVTFYELWTLCMATLVLQSPLLMAVLWKRPTAS